MKHQNYWLPEQPANDNRRVSELREFIITLAVCGCIVLTFAVFLKPVILGVVDLTEWVERL